MARPAFPSPVVPGRDGALGLLPRASHPAVASSACRGGDRHWALARAKYSSSDGPPIYEATHNVRPRGAPTPEDSNLRLSVWPLLVKNDKLPGKMVKASAKIEEAVASDRSPFGLYGRNAVHPTEGAGLWIGRKRETLKVGAYDQFDPLALPSGVDFRPSEVELPSSSQLRLIGTADPTRAPGSGYKGRQENTFSMAAVT
jgi:hypothetical protein